MWLAIFERRKSSCLLSHLRVIPTTLWRVGFQSISLGIIDQAIVSATGFATSVIVGRWGSKEELGSYYLMLSVLVFARGVQDSITSTPYTVYWSRQGQERQDTYAGSCLSHQLVLAVITSTALLCLAMAAKVGVAPRELVFPAAVLVIFGPALLLKEFLRKLSFAHTKMAAAIKLDVVVAFVQVVGLILAAIAGMLFAASVYAVIGLACIMACVVWFVGDYIRFRFVWDDIGEDWKSNWSFGKWALAGTVTGSIVPAVIPWTLGYLHGLGEAGLLAAGFALVGPCNILVIGVQNTLAPRAVEARIQGGQRALWAVLRNTSVVLVIALAVYFFLSLLFGEFIAVLLFGPRFEGAGVIMAMLSLAFLINSLGITAGVGLYALEQTRMNFVVDLIAALFALCATVFLIVPLGVFGAAAASVATPVVTAIGKWLVLFRSNPKQSLSSSR